MVMKRKSDSSSLGHPVVEAAPEDTPSMDDDNLKRSFQPSSPFFSLIKTGTLVTENRRAP